MLPFQRQLITDICTDDALVVLGRGLGLQMILLELIKIYAVPEALILLINATDADEEFFRFECARNQPPLPFHQVTSETAHRHDLYLTGGVFSVTSRILAVDLLCKRIPVDMIAGIVVCHAHQVSEYCNETLILRLFRAGNQSGFIKAFSENPESITGGFAQLEKLLRWLHLAKVFLWPRFHMTVQADLDACNIDLAEYHQPLSPRMHVIQQAIQTVIEACLQEIKRANPAISVEELALENALLPSFDRKIRLLLDPIWHRLSWRTKNLFNDIRTLKKMLRYLLQYDCVQFLNYLETVLSEDVLPKPGSRQEGSPWLVMDEAETVFKLAQSRVYTVSKETKSIVPVLEENPKWTLLSELLEEIENEVSVDTTENSKYPISSASILVMCADQQTARTIRDYLKAKSKGTPNHLRDSWAIFLKWNQKLKHVLGKYEVSKTHEAVVTKPAEPEQPARKRVRRTRGGHTTGALNERSASANGNANSSRLDAYLNLEHEYDEMNLLGQPDQDDEHEDGEENDHPFVLDDYFGLLEPNRTRLNLLITSYDGHLETFHQLLNNHKPRFVVMYDASPAFVRSLEVYKAQHPGLPLRVYFTVYENSIEEQNYLTSIKREKQAFESLIREKAVMSVQQGQDGRKRIETPANLLLPQLYSLSSRNSGDSLARLNPLLKSYEERPRVVVDMREFRSQLPCILYAKGFQVVPETLEVGDYVLTPNTVVERKAVQDLISSLNSGRLHTQAESMIRHYDTSVLLIEFEENKYYSIENATDALTGTNPQSMESSLSKLIALTLQFPKLNVFWSCSLNATIEVFNDLKLNKSEPDPEQAASIGVELLMQDAETRLNSSDLVKKTNSSSFYQKLYNFAPVELLQKMPGLDGPSHRYALRGTPSLKTLSDLSLETLSSILGNNSRASLLFEFMNRE